MNVGAKKSHAIKKSSCNINTLTWRYDQNTSKHTHQEAIAITDETGFVFNVTITNLKQQQQLRNSKLFKIERRNELNSETFVSYFDKRPPPKDQSIFWEYRKYQCHSVSNMTSPLVCLNDWLMLEYEC